MSYKTVLSMVCLSWLYFVFAVPQANATDQPRLPNPFIGATWYVNPLWRDHVLQEPGGKLIANNSTTIWFDQISMIAPTNGHWGLATHLDKALEQKANLVSIMLYDMPNRDCSALASSGELKISERGIERYKHEYIDAIVEILGREKYRGLRIIVIVEPDSLPNLVTNLNIPKCREAAGSGGYVEATRYALDALYNVPSVYSYVDIGHSGWLGWDDNLNKTSTFIAEVIKSTTHGVASVAGFISNTSNYTPLNEPFLDAYQLAEMPNLPGTQIRQSRFYQWNPQFGELGYVRAFRAKMIEQGFSSTIGMLIDTSRNGWGGTNRPTHLAAAADVESFVDQSRIDHRPHRGMWCNQPGGIGERPTATPVPGVDAYIWAKPPGESDGVSKVGVVDANDPAKRFDRTCDPTYAIPGTSGLLTGAMLDAPHAGYWFSSGFKVLLENAWPPLK